MQDTEEVKGAAGQSYEDKDGQQGCRVKQDEVWKGNEIEEQGGREEIKNI